MKKRVGLFLLLIALGGWPSNALRARISAALSPVLTSLLAPCTFGQGGHAMVRSAPVADVRRVGENVTADAELRLTIDGFVNESINAINLRRDFYLPLWIAFVVALVAPSTLAQRAWALALSLPTAFAACFGALCLTICWLFAHQASVIYPLDEGALQLLDALVGTLLMPPTLRFVFPLLIALGAVYLAKQLSAYARAAKPSHPTTQAAPPATP